MLTLINDVIIDLNLVIAIVWKHSEKNTRQSVAMKKYASDAGPGVLYFGLPLDLSLLVKLLSTNLSRRQMISSVNSLLRILESSMSHYYKFSAVTSRALHYIFCKRAFIIAIMWRVLSLSRHPALDRSRRASQRALWKKTLVACHYEAPRAYKRRVFVFTCTDLWDRQTRVRRNGKISICAIRDKREKNNEK